MKSVYKIGLKKFCGVSQNRLYEFLPFGYSCYSLKEYKGYESDHKGDDETRPSFVYNAAREEHCRYQEATGIYESEKEELEGLDAYIKACIRDSAINQILD